MGQNLSVIAHSLLAAACFQHVVAEIPYSGNTTGSAVPRAISYAPLTDLSRFPMPVAITNLHKRKDSDLWNDPDAPAPDPSDDYSTGIHYDDPVEAWKNGKLIQPYSFWHKSAETSNESGAVEAFGDFMNAYHNDASAPIHCKKDGIPAMPCFAYHFAGDANYKCRGDQIHSCRIPGAREVMNHISARFPVGTVLPNSHVITERYQVELGRQVLFTMLNFNEVMQTISSTQKLLQLAGETFQRKTSAIVGSFSPQPDPRKALQCEVFKFAMKEFIDWYKKRLVLGFKFISGLDLEHMLPGELQEYSPKIIKMIMENQKLYQKYFKSWREGEGEHYTSTDTWKMYYEKLYQAVQMGMGLTGASVPGPPGSIRGVPAEKLGLTVSTSKGICGTIFGVANDDNGARESQLSDFIDQYTESMMQKTSEAFERLFVYDAENDPQDLNLRFAMSMDYLENVARFNAMTWWENKAELEQSITNVLASELLASSRCFAECNERDDAQEVCRISELQYKFRDKGSHAQQFPDGNHVWCPKENVVCRLGCYEKKQGFNRKLELPGAMWYGSWGISMGAVKNGTWNNFVYAQEYQRDPYGKKVMIDDGIIAPDEETLRLPVCYNQGRTVEWDDKFPFQCGGFEKSWDSKETGPFLKEINVQYIREDFMLAKKQMAHALHTLWPADHYLLMCHNGLRWPWRRTKGVEKPSVPVSIRRGMGTDPDCDRMEAEVKYMTRDEANLHYCISETGIRIQNREMKRLAFPARVGNHKHKNSKATKAKCKNWQEEHKERIPEIEVEMVPKREKALKEMEEEMKAIEKDRRDWNQEPMNEEERERMEREEEIASRESEEEAGENDRVDGGGRVEEDSEEGAASDSTTNDAFATLEVDASF